MDKISLRKALLACSETVEQGVDTHSLNKAFFIPKDFIAFQGHFPDKPVLPAVVQILMAEVTVEEALGIKVRLQEVMQAKFTLPIEPDAHIICSVSSRTEGVWDSTIMANGVLAAKFRWQGEKR